MPLWVVNVADPLPTRVYVANSVAVGQTLRLYVAKSSHRRPDRCYVLRFPCLLDGASQHVLRTLPFQ